ncbi:MAG: TIGR02099 family protein [Betaproteobacteria bacterium]|nr:TIGR02099 family protein [Betaproteobacteria bacterium]
MALRNRLRWLGITTLWAYRILTWSVLAAGLAFASVVLALRYWILPNIENYREDIARVVSERSRQKITIGRIHANWEGLRPHLVLEQVTVYDAAGRPALDLSRVDNTLSWLTLPSLELRFHALDIYRPTLNVRRDARGVISVAGIELTGEAGEGGFADWLLRQRDIEVHDATLVWNDEQRGAPQLELKNVFLHVFTRGSRYRFGLRAVPPRELAAPIDFRGDLRAGTVKSLADWHGRLFLQLDYADIAAWRTWIAFPIEFPRGAGALRAWLSFNRNQLVDAVADVKLADVRTRLAQDLPELDLTELAGRIGWKQSGAGVEVSTSKLALVTSGGLALPPADFVLRLTSGDARRPARGEMQANALELTPLVALADHLPLGNEARKRLAEFSPKGAVYDLAVQWTGDWRDPQGYTIRGRFQNLALNRAGKIPGFNGVSGTLEAGERGGTLSLTSYRTTVQMPLVFRDALEFESLTAQVAWTRSGGETELKLNNISFSNPHLAGTVFGNYRTAGSARGSIDLTGNLTRADARFGSRYIPLVVGKGARDWMDKAFLAGQSSDVTLRVKGNLDEFPFPESKGGVFQVAARVTGGVLHYATGWPNIENIAGDLVFRGKRMDVRARQGTLSGVRLGKVHAEIPDLVRGEEVLNVTGEAEGATSDFFAFIENSPVAGMIDHFTEGWQAQGSGKLALKLSIPLSAAAIGNTRLAGAYQFTGNTVVIAPGLPAVEQAGGQVEFTDSSVRAQNVSGVVLGGPVTIAATTSRDATVRITLQGRVNADGVRRAGGPFWVQHLRGSTDWRAAVNARKRDADVVIESSLQGLAVDLPAPIVKTASELMPLRFERRLIAANQDRLSVSVGEIVSMNLVRGAAGGRAAITHGAVRFGGPAAEPERPGIWVSGTVKSLDADRWLGFFGQGGGETRVDWGGVDLKLGALDLFRRRFDDLAVNAVAQGGRWRASLSGREIDGTVTWQPQGRGRIVARLKTLTVPAAAPAVAQVPGEPGTDRKLLELPALDIVSEQFVNKNKALGRLEISAVPEGRNWRIEKLRIVNPESTFTLDGLWHVSLSQPRTQVSLRLEASDVGKLLTRLGYPKGVRRGTSKLEGALSWNGAPHDIDYPSLSGNFVLEAAKGQFVKLDPGIGKLLGILSLQALPRRITLDFRDVFSEGFSFDEIVGAVKINRGIASTENFRMQGPPARITMSGEVDLARESQNLRVRITPHVSDTLSIAGAIVGGPVAGVAAFLAQKMLKDPLDEAASYEYNVTGTWSEPSVTRVEQKAGPGGAQEATGQ